MNDEAGARGRHRTDRLTELVAHEAANFIVREAGTDSLITVTRAKSSVHGEHVTVFVSIFPIEKAKSALAFLERQREAFSDHLKAHTHLRLPRVEFLLENESSLGGPGGN